MNVVSGDQILWIVFVRGVNRFEASVGVSQGKGLYWLALVLVVRSSSYDFDVSVERGIRGVWTRSHRFGSV